MVVLRSNGFWRFPLILAAILCLGLLRADLADARDSNPPTAAPPAIGGAIFRSFEIRTAPLEGDRKWARVQAAMATERAGFKGCMADRSACATPVLRTWRELVDEAADLNGRALLAAGNRFFNTWRHRDDAEYRGVADHWASPSEFMAGSGDCEDYAIAKYFALELLGLDSARLRIVAVTDRLRGGQHAVLAVYTGGDILILDNTTGRILSHRALPHYAPRRSWSGDAAWAHISAAGLVQAKAERL